MAKESLIVHVQKLFLKKYIYENHNLFIYLFNKVEEKKIT